MNGDHAYPKHIYATGDPETCPILALALFVFMLSKATPRLFGKSGAQKKFRQWFEAFVKKNHDELQGMGVSPPSIGMHPYASYIVLQKNFDCAAAHDVHFRFCTRQDLIRFAKALLRGSPQYWAARAQSRCGRELSGRWACRTGTYLPKPARTDLLADAVPASQ
jgi:hypothetical protein